MEPNKTTDYNAQPIDKKDEKDNLAGGTQPTGDAAEFIVVDQPFGGTNSVSNPSGGSEPGIGPDVMNEAERERGK